MVRYIIDTDKLTDMLCTKTWAYHRLVLVLCSSAAACRQSFMFKNTEFLNWVACLFKNVFPTLPATWMKGPVQEYFLYEHTLNN